MTLTFVLVLGVVWFAKQMYYHRFLEFLQLPFSNKYFSAALREKNLENPFTLIMLVVQIISFGVFVWYMITTHHIKIFNAIKIEYWMALVGVFVFVLTKLVVQILVSAILNINRITYQYIYRKISYLNFSSFVLLIGMAFAFYNKNLSSIFLILSVFVFLLLNFIGILDMLKNYQKLILNYFLYIILYLCAFEIAPLLILGAYITIY
ncbi:DUF4271 domain-containing protein [Neptunitalea chrysea]|uniref:DUF4271 domain-containing protein n=1 Tax=Neptunitalea chrysea TaxID=1647581 RepID=UPI0035A22DC3